jgi:hypothetical protein
MPEPLVGCEILWVSPLAYPNLFGTKDFVVFVGGGGTTTVACLLLAAAVISLKFMYSFLFTKFLIFGKN